jgi:hypothetical protein
MLLTLHGAALNPAMPIPEETGSLNIKNQKPCIF